MVDDINVGLPEKFMPLLYLEAAGKKKPPVDLGAAAKLCTGVDPVPPPRLGAAPLLCTGVDPVPAARLGAAPKLRPGVNLGPAGRIAAANLCSLLTRNRANTLEGARTCERSSKRSTPAKP